MCSFPCYFGSNIVHLIYVSSAVRHEAYASTAVTKPVIATKPGGKKREEIFVDIIERISDIQFECK
jgi:hypothetical protein